MSTDDHGAYRIFQVPPGKYHLSVTYQPQFQEREIRLQKPDGAAEEAYATTYFPGTTDPRQAGVVEVGAGAELARFDLPLQRLHAVHVRGRVVGLDTAPIPVVMISLGPAGSQPGGFGTVLVRDPSGEFDLAGVLPGHYVLSASAFSVDNGIGPSARRAIEVGQTDLEGIQLALAAPQKITGMVVVPEGRKIPPGLLVVLGPRERGNRQAGGIGHVDSNGAFTIPSVPAGDYDVAIGALGNPGPGDDLYVSGIHLGDEDVLSKGLHVSGPQQESLEILLKPNGGTVQVAVRNSKGDPLPEARVSLLPDGPRRDQVALFGQCETDARGSCMLRGVTPGDYHAFAFAKDAAVDFRDPDSTTDIEKFGHAVKIAEGDRQSLELEVLSEDR